MGARRDPLKNDGGGHLPTAAASLRELLGRAPSKEAPLSFLVEAISEHDAALLDKLQQAVAKKQRAARNGNWDWTWICARW